MSNVHDSAAKSVSINLKNHMKKDAPKKTKQIVQATLKQKIKSDAINAYNNIKNKKEAAYAALKRLQTITKITTKNSKGVEKTITGLQMNREEHQNKLNIEKDIIKYKGALQKGYEVIMKTRKVITGESISYLVMTDSFSNDPILAKISYDKLAPNIKMSVDRDGKFKLQLFKTDEMLRQTLQTQAKQDNYQKFYNQISENYKIFRQEKRVQGFQLERAVRTVAKNGIDAGYKTDRDAFYTGGDLKGDEIPEGFVENNENLEVKNLASNWGAQLASESTIESTLLVIKAFCDNVSENELKKSLNTHVFSKNIDIKLINAIKKSLETKVDDPIRNALQTMGVTIKN